MSARPAPVTPTSRSARRPGSADHFRLMADFAPVMIWLADPDRRSVYFNRPWLEFTGRPLDGELGLGWTEGLHPEDRPNVESRYAQAFAERAPFEIEYRLRRADGEHRWILDKGVPLFEDGRLAGFVGSCLDITDRLDAEREARKREEDFKTLADNIPDVIARLDRSLRCVYVNGSVGAVFGRAPASIIGRRADELELPDNIRDTLTGAAARALDSGEEQRFRFRETGGARRHFAGRAIPEPGADGRVEAVLLITYDVTARAREDEKRVGELEQERVARANAESATLARDQFLAIVSHELRSPLNGIKSWTHVLDNHLRGNDATVRRAIAGIMIGVDHQVRLIEDLLDVTRAMSGNLGLAKQTMSLLPVLVESVENLRAMAAEKGLGIVTDYGAEERAIHGDPDRIRQIFVNLLTNAIKFTSAGGTIRIAVAADGAMAKVSVKDDGMGIAPEFLPYLFDPFRQADQGKSSRRQEGLGLGLALVQRLAELHGGYVTCESGGLDRGATFNVFLPIRHQDAAPVAVGHSMHETSFATSLPSLGGIGVILIDDQREARESLAALLQQAGAKVLAASSGKQALEHLRESAALAASEVIVCDIAMPGEDGYATLKRIREWEKAHAGGKHRPAIALSAFTQREDRIRALSEGFQMYLTKPVVPAELVIVIASVVRGMRV
jgi:PAS domain S-box-containing protein